MDIDSLPLQVTALLGSVMLPMEEFTQLKEGDVLLINQCVTEPLSLCVCEEKKFLAYLGKVKNHKAVKLEAIL